MEFQQILHSWWNCDPIIIFPNLKKFLNKKKFMGIIILELLKCFVETWIYAIHCCSKVVQNTPLYFSERYIVYWYHLLGKF